MHYLRLERAVRDAARPLLALGHHARQALRLCEVHPRHVLLPLRLRHGLGHGDVRVVVEGQHHSVTHGEELLEGAVELLPDVLVPRLTQCLLVYVDKIVPVCL